MPVLDQGDCLVGTDLDAEAAAVAVHRVDQGGVGLERDLAAGQEAAGPGGRGQGLGDRFLQRFGVVGETGNKHPVDVELHRPQLGVGLLEKAVGAQRQLEQAGQFVRVRAGQDGGGEDDHVRRDLQRPVEHVIPDAHEHAVAFDGLTSGGPCCS